MIHRRFAPGRSVLGLAVSVVAGLLAMVPLASAAEARWWKGNLHTHSLWSDGDDFPESIADWYKQHGYHFLAMSDHNRMLEGEQWVTESQKNHFPEALEKNRRRFGADWLVRRDHHGTNQFRLKTLEEFRGLLEEPGRFLMIPSEEITSGHLSFPVHINATNLRKKISAQGGTNVLDVMQRGVNAVLDQRRQTGQPMFPHINHPNFGWGITAEDLMQVKGERFFEVYNGHPATHNEGDTTHAGTERMWDIILAWRIGKLDLPPMYGLAVDDSHHYHSHGVGKSNSGRGWVMVRSERLEPASIVLAMEAGDFYSSSGVSLRQIQRTGNTMRIEVEAEPGITYTIRFIGTRKGFDASRSPVVSAKGEPVRATQRYSDQIGETFSVVVGSRAEYSARGDELYVRAVVHSSKKIANPYRKGETAAAWIQPWQPR
jgi:predicted metal-dependent phosphoesterase TrpH